MRIIVDPQIEVPQYPKIPEDCHIIIEDNKIQIYGIEDSVVLTGEKSLPVVKKILPLLDGRHSLDDIIKSVNKEEKDLVPLALKYLYMKGLFEDYSDVAHKDMIKQSETQKYFSRLVDVTRYSKNRYEVNKKIETYHIQIVTDSRLGMDFYKELSQAGFRHIEIITLTGLKEDIQNTENSLFVDKFDDINLQRSLHKESHIVCVFSRNHPRVFSTLNKIAYSHKQLLTLGFLTDKTAILGPTFIPDETGCFECYEQRQMMNMNNLDSYLTYKEFLNNSSTPFSHTDYNKKIFIGILTSEIINISTFITMPQSFGYEIEFDFVKFKLEKRMFYRLPVCKVCSKKTTAPDYTLIGEKR